MQYHAHSLAVNGAAVDLIGLEGAPLHVALTAEPRIRSHRLSDRRFLTRGAGGRGRFVVASAARALAQAAGLLRLLWRIPRPAVILVQNPPATPTLACAWLVARLRGARLVIDWHNLSHSILAVKLGESHRAVRALARAERRWGQRADGHLAVSRQLADWLQRTWGIHATVVYDRPHASFHTPPLDVAAALWARLSQQWQLGPHRLPLVVAPTSWTPDEDFDLLLDALERTERTLAAAATAPAGPQLLVVLTGRGQLREAFEHRLARRRFSCLAVRTAWLEPADYPTLIGIADAGLCLHQSSSGLDLPMKLADFRGAGVPACAFDYGPVLAEALTPGEEGVSFRDAGELSAVLVALATNHLDEVPALVSSRRWLAAHPPEHWSDHWQRQATAVLLAGRPRGVRPAG